jgi:hypothetical protein
MILATRVRLVSAESPDTRLAGVKVSLYDRDLTDEDDFLGTGVSDAKGEVFFRYDSERYTDAEDQPLWRTESLPDLYVVVYGADGNAALTTKAVVEKDKLPRVIIVPVPRETAVRCGLMAE